MARRKHRRRDPAQLELPGIFQNGRSVPPAPKQFAHPAKGFDADEEEHVRVKFTSETIRGQFRKVLRDSTQDVVCTVRLIEETPMVIGVTRVPRALVRPLFPFRYGSSGKWELIRSGERLQY